MHSEYVEAWQRRFEQERMKAIALAKHARTFLPQAFELLKGYGATRVILFGSLCRPEKFHARSDLDLAVSGIPSDKFIRASADVMMALDWPTDIKRWEELDDFFREMILKRGEMLYEK